MEGAPAVHSSMKANIIFGLLVTLAVIWAVAVINATGNWEPWKAWGLALFGGFSISTVGLRMRHLNRKILRQHASAK